VLPLDREPLLLVRLLPLYELLGRELELLLRLGALVVFTDVERVGVLVVRVVVAVVRVDPVDELLVRVEEPVERVVVLVDRVVVVLRVGAEDVERVTVALVALVGAPLDVLVEVVERVTPPWERVLTVFWLPKVRLFMLLGPPCERELVFT